MNSILKRIPFLALIVTVVAAIGATSASAAPSPGTLYVQQALGGSLTKKGGAWQLALRDPALRTITFTDRPARLGGSLALSKFISSWHAKFGADAPNAALQITNGPASRDVVLLELSSPYYNPSRGLLLFKARPLRSSSDPALSALAHRADRGVHGGFSRASVFIDSGEEGNLVTFEFHDMPREEENATDVEIQLVKHGDRFLFSPPATFLSSTEWTQWGIDGDSFTLRCSFGTCSGTATVAVSASPTEPLTGIATLPATGEVTASWAGGPTTKLPLGSSGFSLQPAKP